MTKKTGFVLAVISLLALLTAGAAHADDWEYVSDRNPYRVAVYVQIIHQPAGGCTIGWRAENQNNFRVEVTITNKEYVWSGGSTVVKSGVSTSGRVAGDSTKFLGSDSISRSPGDPQSRVRVGDFDISVEKL